jgi:hypothetical protein
LHSFAQVCLALLCLALLCFVLLSVALLFFDSFCLAFPCFALLLLCFALLSSASLRLALLSFSLLFSPLLCFSLLSSALHCCALLPFPLLCFVSLTLRYTLQIRLTGWDHVVETFVSPIEACFRGPYLFRVISVRRASARVLRGFLEVPGVSWRFLEVPGWVVGPSTSWLARIERLSSAHEGL